MNIHPAQQFSIGCKIFNTAKVCIDDFWDVLCENKAFIDNASRNNPFEPLKIVKRATEALGGVHSHWGIFVGHGTISHLVGVDDCSVDMNIHPAQQFSIGCKIFNKAKVCIDDFWDV
ncbi:hypothetical protein Btru_032429 [Bulinus truncatus]|nr:hypothetical protein Btru_032429 [Bulinus truncatus]